MRSKKGTEEIIRSKAGASLVIIYLGWGPHGRKISDIFPPLGFSFTQGFSPVGTSPTWSLKGEKKLEKSLGERRRLRASSGSAAIGSSLLFQAQVGHDLELQLPILGLCRGIRL